MKKRPQQRPSIGLEKTKGLLDPLLPSPTFPSVVLLLPFFSPEIYVGLSQRHMRHLYSTTESIIMCVLMCNKMQCSLKHFHAYLRKLGTLWNKHGSIGKIVSFWLISFSVSLFLLLCLETCPEFVSFNQFCARRRFYVKSLTKRP